MKRTRAEVLREIEEENAELPTDRLDIRIVASDVEFKRVPITAPENHFVYVQETDRTRFVGVVAARLTADPDDEDFIQRAIVVFEKGFTAEFAMGVVIEIELLVRADCDELDPITHSVFCHINTSDEMLKSLKSKIVL